MLDIKSLTVTSIISMVVVFIIGPLLIPMLHKLKFGQTIRDDGPKSHLAKNGTPTMGGVMIILAIVIAVLLRGPYNFEMLIGLVCMLGFGTVGLLDDYIKIVKKRSLGLTPIQKIVLQVLFSLIVAVYKYIAIGDGVQFLIPFTNMTLNIGILYIPVIMFVIIGTVNAVNLTDGLDGLAGGITAIVSTFFAIYAVVIAKSPEVSTLSAATMGACIGFLWFNINPAKVFMGDTGSMALGGAVVAFAVLTNTVLIIPIVGGIYFAEALSVIIQVGYYKRTKKRIFKMAPLHHHFEQCGWKETKVVFIFWIVAVILSMVGVLGLF